MQHNDFILTLSCPDRTGIVYRVSGLLFDHGCNILDAQQFGDEESGRFFLRVHFDAPAGVAAEDLRARLAAMSEEYGMELKLHDARRKERLLIMVSKQGHCLNDLLFRVHSGHLHAEVAAIVSNHNDYAVTWRLLRHSVPLPAGHGRHQGGTGAAGAGPGRARTHRSGGAGALHADPVTHAVPRAGRPCDQHPPQLPAQLQGRAAVSPGTRAWGQDHRRHRQASSASAPVEST